MFTIMHVYVITEGKTGMWNTCTNINWCLSLLCVTCTLPID